MSPITTHVLDTLRGRPAAGIAVRLEQIDAQGTWHVLGNEETNADGRVETLLTDSKIAAGLYRLTFETGDYWDDSEVATFYPRVVIEFEVHEASGHYHVPLLLSPFSFTTYRGS